MGLASGQCSNTGSRRKESHTEARRIRVGENGVRRIRLERPADAFRSRNSHHVLVSRTAYSQLVMPQTLPSVFNHI